MLTGTHWWQVILQIGEELRGSSAINTYSSFFDRTEPKRGRYLLSERRLGQVVLDDESDGVLFIRGA